MKFYVTYDHRYIIKTMTSEDVAQIHEILERYYKVSFIFIFIEDDTNTIQEKFYRFREF